MFSRSLYVGMQTTARGRGGSGANPILPDLGPYDRGEVFATEDEEQVYAHLGYQFVPPELRENTGELEAAREGRLPALVELGDLRGDLHAHSTWSSDGKATLEEMALAARARGYAYLAVTDHSHYLRDGRLEQQAA